jgi:hypothetical protein
MVPCRNQLNHRPERLETTFRLRKKIKIGIAKLGLSNRAKPVSVGGVKREELSRHRII